MGIETLDLEAVENGEMKGDYQWVLGLEWKAMKAL